MSVSELFEDIDINKKKSKIIIKWIVYISIALVSAAFIAGQFWINRNSKLDNIQNKVDKIELKVSKIETKVDSGFKNVDFKFSKGYQDGLNIMREYQNHVQSQLELLVDYGNENKELLKSSLKLRDEDNNILIEQSVKSAVEGINNNNNNINNIKEGNITWEKIKDDDNNKYNTMLNISLLQIDSLSRDNKIIYIKPISNNKYNVKYIKK